MKVSGLAKLGLCANNKGLRYFKTQGRCTYKTSEKIAKTETSLLAHLI
jgi:hypothetical protein